MLVYSFLLLLILCASQINCFLMYPPEATSLGLVASVSVPISEYFPKRRMLVDWCFTMGYSLPSSPSQFYNVPIWPVKQGTRNRRDISESIPFQNDTRQDFYKKYENDQLSERRHPTDFTAGELYQSTEDFLATYGFHETCLLRTVCELARHPFDDQHQNVLVDIVTFFLTPSWHEGFDESEQLYREVYEEAETRGFYGEDCMMLYPDCQTDLLSIMTKVMFPNE